MNLIDKILERYNFMIILFLFQIWKRLILDEEGKLERLLKFFQHHEKFKQEHNSTIRQKGIKLNHDFYVVFGKH